MVIERLDISGFCGITRYSIRCFAVSYGIDEFAVWMLGNPGWSKSVSIFWSNPSSRCGFTEVLKLQAGLRLFTRPLKLDRAGSAEPKNGTCFVYWSSDWASTSTNLVSLIPFTQVRTHGDFGWAIFLEFKRAKCCGESTHEKCHKSNISFLQFSISSHTASCDIELGISIYHP